MTKNITDLIEQYAKTKYELEVSKRNLKRATKAERDAERDLVDCMIETGIDSLKVRDCTFYLRSQFWVSVTQENQDDIVAWLKERGVPLDDFVKTVLNKADVVKYLKRVVETEGKHVIPECMKLNTAPAIGTNGWAANYGLSGDDQQQTTIENESENESEDET